MSSMSSDEAWMRKALALAHKAEGEGEVPVGAILVQDDVIIGQGWNRPIHSHDPSAHAEIQALRSGGYHSHNYRLPDTTLYVTLEPCTMCAGAIIHARIARVVFGAFDPRTGAVESVTNVFDQPHHNHRPDYLGGVLETECSMLLKSFFEKKRLKK